MSITQEERPTQWLTKLEQQLPLMGHRNWIVIADAAYPLQVAEGIETVSTDAEHLDVLRSVLSLLEELPHMRPVIYLDHELQFLSEAEATGAIVFRESLARQFNGLRVHSQPHEQIISQLDEAGKTFHILVLKTKATIPYTSIFLQLDCKYWSDVSEKALRQRIREAEVSYLSEAEVWKRTVFCLGDF